MLDEEAADAVVVAAAENCEKMERPRLRTAVVRIVDSIVWV